METTIFKEYFSGNDRSLAENEDLGQIKLLLDSRDKPVGVQILGPQAGELLKDDFRRSQRAAQSGVHYLDAGTSGGVWGLRVGYCLMIGGTQEAFAHVKPLLAALAPEEGYLHCGPTGAGHFVKMIHNGIEYGMMQAYAEGFGILEDSPYAGHLNYEQLSHLWNQGSVIRSWLLELAELAFAQSPRLEDLQGYVQDSGEGRWTVQQAVETASSAPVLTLSLMERFRSRRENAFPDRFLAALRQQFGGHAVKKSE